MACASIGIGVEQGAEAGSPRIIVSFTSYPGRIHAVPRALTSLYKQSKRPDRILLWLAEEQFPNKEADLPQALVDEAAVGRFELRWCDDLGSHKKYFYAMQEFPDDIIIIVDDDTFYHPDTVRALHESYLRHPKAVSALFVIGIVFDRSGELAPYSVWLKNYRLSVGRPSMQLMAVGGPGVLYPPRSVDHRGFDKKRILTFCKYNGRISGDDFWLKAHSALNGIPVVLVDADLTHTEIKDTQTSSLGNDVLRRKFIDNLIGCVSSFYKQENKNELLGKLDTVTGHNFLFEFPSDKYFVEITKSLDLRMDKIDRIFHGKNNDKQYNRMIANMISFQLADLATLQAYGASRKELDNCIATLQRAAQDALSKDHSLVEKDGIRIVSYYSALCLRKLNQWQREPRTYLQLLKNWKQLFHTHPECIKNYYNDCRMLYFDAKGFCKAMERTDISETEITDFRSSIEKAWKSVIEEMEPQDLPSTGIPEVSVIVPVWNPGSGIERCIASLRGQTLADIEIIFVDDCGADGAMDAVRAAAAEDSRIRIVTNPENLGPGPSRNAGIETARGEYLSFVDADDYISPGFLELLYAKAHAENLDIAKGTAVYMMDGLPKQKDFVWNAFIRSGLAQGKPLYRLFKDEHWTGLYRRALLIDSGARYGSPRASEDSLFLLRVCHAARHFGMEDRATYHYVYRKESASSVQTTRKFGEQLESLGQQLDYCVGRIRHDWYLAEHVAKKIEFMLQTHLLAARSLENEAEADAFLAGIREQALRLPFLPEVKKLSRAVRALADYGVNLIASPLLGHWKELDNAHARIYIAKRWCDFALAHPELADEYGMDLSQVLQKAAEAVKLEKRYGPRIDVKIYGTENSELELRGVSGKAKVGTPEWLRKFGQPGVGYVVVPYAGQTEITLDFLCKTGGEFRAELRGANVTDGGGKRIPKWVAYTGLTCNGETVFAGEQMAWHDQPYRYKKTVAAGEEIRLEIGWREDRRS